MSQAGGAGDPFPFFHLLPSNYSLDDLSTLTSAQLAAAWVLHPDYDEAKHSRKIAKLWRSRREKGRHLIGVSDIGIFASEEQRAQDPCYGFELIDLGSWDIPSELSTLTSAQLAALPFHPQFQADAHAEQAEDIFYKRRDRGGSVTMLDAIAGKAAPPSETPKPSVTPTAEPSDSSAASAPARVQNATATGPSGTAAVQDQLHQPSTDVAPLPAHLTPLPASSASSATVATTSEAAASSHQSRVAPVSSPEQIAVRAPSKEPDTEEEPQLARPDGESPNLLPEGLVETWSILHLNGISRDMPVNVVWSLLSPPHLPPPIAVKLRPARPAPGYAESNFYLCFAAYRTEEDSDLAQRGLNGATFGKNTVKAERSVSKRRAAVWEWTMLSDEYRQSLAGVDLSQYAQHTVSARPQARQSQQKPQKGERLGPERARRDRDQAQHQPPQRDRDVQRGRDNRDQYEGPPSKRKRRDHHPQDLLPPALADRLASVQIYNLPVNIVPADVYAYFPPVLAGVAITTDPKDVHSRKPAPGRIFLAFEDPDVRRDIILSHVAKKQFPGCDRTMWYRTDDVKQNGWSWSEMSEGFKMHHGRSGEPAPPIGYPNQYEWQGSPGGPWAGRGNWEHPPDYRAGPPMGPPGGYYARPDDWGYPRYDDYAGPDVGGPVPYGARPDAYGRSDLAPPPPGPERHGAPLPAEYSRDFGYRSGPLGPEQPRYDATLPHEGLTPPQHHRATRVWGSASGGHDRQDSAGSPVPFSGPDAARDGPFERENGHHAKPHAPQADLDSLLATLKRPETGEAGGRKRDWDDTQS